LGKFFELLADREGWSTIEDVFGMEHEPEDDKEIETLRNHIEWLADTTTLSGYDDEEYDELVKRMEEINAKATRMLDFLDEIEEYMEKLHAWGYGWKDFTEKQMESQNEADS
jgi:hypothetical protein